MFFYKIRYSLDPRFVLKYKTEKGVELPDAVWEEAQSRISAAKLIKLEIQFNQLTVAVCAEQGLSEEEISDITEEIEKKLNAGEMVYQMEEATASELANLSGILPEDQKYLLHYVNPEDQQKEKAQTDFATTKEKEEPKQEDPQKNIFETVNTLIGMDELKQWAEEMRAFTALSVEKERLKTPLLSMSYLVSANDGNGCTTIFETMGKVVADILGKKSVEVREITVEPDKENQNCNLSDILKDVSYVDPKSNKLYVFAMRVDKFQNNQYMGAWLELLSGLRNHPNALYLFALPYLETVALNEMHDKIEDIMPNRILSVKPFSNADYEKFFCLYFEKIGMTVEAEAISVLPRLIAAEKSDGRFYGIDTIYKICDEILYEKMKSAAASRGSLTNVTKADAEVLLQQENIVDDGGLTGMEKLDALVSMQEVKNRIKEIVASVKTQRAMGIEANGAMHMMFAGPPGTGKTVVARILGQILREEKLLSVGGFYEVTRKDMVGHYIGHTAPKTAEVCHLARGSVLFIDEAYSLHGGGEKDFGKEAISTLIAEMENNRSDFVVIFAGYENELKALFDLNPGLRDRIPYHVKFPSYNREELRDIFYKMLPKEFQYDEDFEIVANNFFETLSSEIMESPNFSNARFVRNLTERVISKASLRMHMGSDGSCDKCLRSVDFNLAISDSEFQSVNDKKKNRVIGF